LTVYNKVAEQRLDEEQHQQAAGEVRNSRQALGSGRRSARTDDNVDTVESLLQSQEDKTSEQPNSQSNFHRYQFPE